MNLHLHRKWLTDLTTIGELTVDGVFQCFILEDKFRGDAPKIDGWTAIPNGRYLVEITDSPRFKRKLPLLHDVPGFKGIRIHPGNVHEDTEGCLLPGVTRGVDRVDQSRVAFDALFTKLEHAAGPVWITVTT